MLVLDNFMKVQLHADNESTDKSEGSEKSVRIRYPFAIELETPS